MNENSRPSRFPASESALWRVEMFGGLRARRLEGVGAGKIVDSFRTQKDGALLAFLTLERRMHKRDLLAELWWPDVDIISAKNSLRVALSSLRKVLENTEEKGRVLRSTRDSIGAGTALTSDLEEFHFCVQLARQLQGEERTDALEGAFNLVTGPFLRGYYDDWALNSARRFEREFLDVARQVMATREAAGELMRALNSARHAAMVVPDSDNTMKDIVRLGLLVGESVSVRREFESWKKRRQEQGGDSAQEWEQLVDGFTVRRVVPPQGSLPTSVPPIQEGNGRFPVSALRPRSLPAPLSSFVGRKDDQEEIALWLRDPGVRLITLLGAGGAGKTRLALEIARTVREQEEFEAVAWVSAANINSLRIIYNALCDALGVLPNGADVTSLARALGGASAGRRILVVFDNFEHLEEEGGRWLESLLEAVPRITALVTSRIALRTQAERLWIMAPLLSKEKEENALLDGVRLFIERATLVRPDFSPSAVELEEIARICQALGGMPLAIEVAAARLALFSPAQLGQEIENARQPRLIKAVGGTIRRSGLLLDPTLPALVNPSSSSMLDWPNRDVNAPARHRTLREAIEWSARQLPSRDRQFWARASIFQDAFSLEAASEVCEEPNPAPLLLSLRDSSLLSLQTGGHVPRASWNDALREFAQGLVTPEERVRLDARHATYFARYAREMGDVAGVGVDGVPVTRGKSDEAQSVRRAREELEASRADFRAALEWFLEHDPEGGLEMGAYIWATWAANKRWAEGRSLLTRVLHSSPVPSKEMPEEELRPKWKRSWELRARALEGAGALSSIAYDVTSARNFFDAARHAFERCGDAAGVARCLNAAGLAALQGGDLNAARHLSEQSLSLEDQALRQEGRYALFNLSLVAIVNGDFATVRDLATEGLNLHRAQNDLHGVTLCLENLGQVSLFERNYSTARVYYEAARKNFQSLGVEAGVVRAWWGLGQIARGEGNLAEAKVCFNVALDTLKVNEHVWAIPYLLEAVALWAQESGDCSRAVRLLEGAKQLRRTESIGLPRPFFGADLDQMEVCCREKLGIALFDAERLVAESLSRDELLVLARA